MLIQSLSAYLINWDFTRPVKHSLATNKSTNNILVALESEDGLSGIGEGVPRSYVTGETVEAALHALRSELAPLVMGREIDPGAALGYLSAKANPNILDRAPAAACALETALWDMAAKALGKPASDLLGQTQYAPLVYSAVLPLVNRTALKGLLARIRELGMREVKVKAGLDDDLERLALIRGELGGEAMLRVDANGAWDMDQALSLLPGLKSLDVKSLEQPLPAGDLEGLARLASQTEMLIMADESACTLEQARRLAESGVALNLRLSKCGGPWRTMEMLNTAHELGACCQLGCQVGELGPLSAAGRHFAASNRRLIHLEGCLTRFFLDRDVINEELGFGRSGRAEPLRKPGLGVTMRKPELEKSLAYRLN